MIRAAVVLSTTAAVAGQCPSGSLSGCMDLCPASPASAYKACVDDCVTKCSSGPTPPAPTPPEPTPSPPSPPAPPSAAGKCTLYKKDSDNCATSNCGSCFNPGARSGVLFGGQQPGYYGSSDVGPGNSWTGACLDWTLGSQAMLRAEAAFNSREGQSVYFGVGTYGTSSDGQQGLGACYRITVDGVDRDLLVQSVNTGSDVAGNQFDLQVGDGGAGAYNNCAGASGAMFPGPYDGSTWGKQYGGEDTRAQCANLPEYPQESGPMKAAGDNLVKLCEYSFDKKVRGEGGSNPTIQDLTRVKCPPELVEMTQLQRSDDPATYVHTNLTRGVGFPNAHKCGLDQPGGTAAWCLTRMMDCRKPSGAFKDNIKPELVVAGKKLVQTCLPDGYTRIDVQCGCFDCYC